METVIAALRRNIEEERRMRDDAEAAVRDQNREIERLSRAQTTALRSTPAALEAGERPNDALEAKIRAEVRDRRRAGRTGLVGRGQHLDVKERSLSSAGSNSLSCDEGITTDLLSTMVGAVGAKGT